MRRKKSFFNAKKQKQAFELLKKEVFSNGAMNYDPKILANLVFERDSVSYYASFGDNNQLVTMVYLSE